MSHNTTRLINLVKFGCSIMLASCLVSQDANAACQGNPPSCEAGRAAICVKNAYTCTVHKMCLFKTSVKCLPTQNLECVQGLWKCI
jgi:hypothetical protein